jgi:hypothetical protein
VIRARVTLSRARLRRAACWGRERGQPTCDPGRKSAPRLLPSEECHGQRQAGDRDESTETCRTGTARQRGAPEIGEPVGGGSVVRGCRVGDIRRLDGCRWRLGRDRIPGQDEAARVLDGDHEAIGRPLDPPDRVEGVVRLDQREQVERAAADDDVADGGPVIEREAVRSQVDHEPTHTDDRSDVRIEIDQVGVKGS